MIGNINHITLSVSDLEESMNFYINVLGFRPLARWDKGSYLLAGNSWICLALDPNTRNRSLPEQTHISFSVSAGHFRKAAKIISDSGAEIWKENNSEGESLYFMDPNGHKLEIHSGSWQSRLAAFRENPYPGMVFFS